MPTAMNVGGKAKRRRSAKNKSSGKYTKQAVRTLRNAKARAARIKRHAESRQTRKLPFGHKNSQGPSHKRRLKRRAEQRSDRAARSPLGAAGVERGSGPLACALGGIEV